MMCDDMRLYQDGGWRFGFRGFGAWGLISGFEGLFIGVQGLGVCRFMAEGAVAPGAFEVGWVWPLGSGARCARFFFGGGRGGGVAFFRFQMVF